MSNNIPPLACITWKEFAGLLGIKSYNTFIKFMAKHEEAPQAFTLGNRRCYNSIEVKNFMESLNETTRTLLPDGKAFNL